MRDAPNLSEELVLVADTTQSNIAVPENPSEELVPIADTSQSNSVVPESSSDMPGGAF